MIECIVNNKKINIENLIESIKVNEGQFSIFEPFENYEPDFICTLNKNNSVYEVDNEKQLISLMMLISNYLDDVIKVRYYNGSITCYKDDKKVLFVKSINKDIPETRLFKFDNENDMNKIVSIIEAEGFKQVGIDVKKITFQWLKNNFKRNKWFVIDAFYNTITRKLEYQFYTIPAIKSYPQHRNAKFITI